MPFWKAKITELTSKKSYKIVIALFIVLILFAAILLPWFLTFRSELKVAYIGLFINTVISIFLIFMNLYINEKNSENIYNNLEKSIIESRKQELNKFEREVLINSLYYFKSAMNYQQEIQGIYSSLIHESQSSPISNKNPKLTNLFEIRRSMKYNKEDALRNIHKIKIVLQDDLIKLFQELFINIEKSDDYIKKIPALKTFVSYFTKNQQYLNDEISNIKNFNDKSTSIYEKIKNAARESIRDITTL